MARAAATFTPTNPAHWSAGLTGSASVLLYWLTEVLQNLEYQAQLHAHQEGVAGDGAVMLSGKAINYWAGAF